MDYYLGFDVSPLRIGVACVEHNDILTNAVFHHTYEFPKDSWVTPAMRASIIEQIADDLVKDKNINGIGLEAVFIGPNKLGSIRAAMALGQVEMACDFEWPDAEQKVLVATAWRKLCGIPQGGKQPVMDWAKYFCDGHTDEPTSQDSADAMAIAFATAMWFNSDE